MTTYTGTDGLTYEYEDTVLTVSGTGNMSALSRGVLTLADSTTLSLTSVTHANIGMVGAIGYSAFYQCNSLASVNILDSVTSIGESAFNSCTSVNTIVVGNGVTSIGRLAFNNCYNLASIRLGDNVTSIGNYAFLYCSKLTTIVIPERVTTLGSNVFSNCSGLTTAVVGSSVSSIGASAFENCTSLTSICFLGNTAPNMSSKVFALGTSSKRVYCTISSKTFIPVSSYYTNNYTNLSYVGFLASGECGTNLKWVLHRGYYTPRPYILIITGTGAMTNYTSSAPWGGYRSQITSVILPNGLTSIGDYAFTGCTHPTSVDIPSGVTYIGIQAFRHWRGLTSVIAIPDGVTSIGTGAFADCTGVTALTVSPSNSAYCTDDGVLYNKSKTILMQYPGGKYDITEYTIPDSVTSIEAYAFECCSGLTSVDIPYSVTSIGASAFYSCSGLTSVDILTNGLTTIENSVFENCTGLTYIVIPDEVVTIGESAFRSCSSLTNVWIGHAADQYGVELEEIEDYAFYGCVNLHGIMLPITLKSIGHSAFRDCALDSVNLHGNDLSVEDCAFEDCAQLTALYIFSGVSYISPGAFNGCINLATITTERNEKYIAENNVLFAQPDEFTTGCTLVLYPPNKDGTYYEVSE